MRIDTESLGSAALTLVAGGSRDTRKATFGGIVVKAAEVQSIYYRRPRPPVANNALASTGEREWIANELRRAWGGWFAITGARWVNHPLAISAASYKPEQLVRAASFGLNIPETIVTTQPQEARAFASEHNMEIIAKPIGHGEVLETDGQRSLLIYTTALGPHDVALLDRVAACPTLLQRRVPKDVDLRVTVAGRSIVAVALHSQDNSVSTIDCRRDNMRRMRYSLVTLPSDTEQRLLALVQSYGLIYAAIDLIRDPLGRLWFLEINPAGQWAWLEQCIGVPISSAIIQALEHD